MKASNDYNITLSTISKTAGPVSSKNPTAKSFGYPVLATHGVDDAPHINLLFVPGGIGLRGETWMFDFIARRFDEVDIVASVCSGASHLAMSGVLNNKRATNNKRNWAGATLNGTNVTWVPTARYVQDGKIWTSSGVAAGKWMTLDAQDMEDYIEAYYGQVWI